MQNILSERIGPAVPPGAQGHCKNSTCSPLIYSTSGFAGGHTSGEMEEANKAGLWLPRTKVRPWVEPRSTVQKSCWKWGKINVLPAATRIRHETPVFGLLKK